MSVFRRIREWIVARPGLGARALMVAGLGLAVFAAACEEYIAGSDALAEPRIIDFGIAPDTLDLTDAGDTAVVTVGARAGAGIDSVRVTFRGPHGDALRRCLSTSPVAGDSTEGSWTCPLGLDRHDPAGDWTVTSLGLLGDTASLFDIDSTALAEAGYPRVIPVVRRALALQSASVLSDTVSAYLDPALVPVRAALTGPRLDSVALTLARGEVSGRCTTAAPVEGSRGDGRWRCEVVIPEGTIPGDWSLSEVTGFPMGLDPVAFGPDSLASFGPPAVTVAAPPVDFVVVRIPGDTLTSAGDTTRATATAYDSREVEIAGVSFAWSSSDRVIATVDSAGLITALGEGSVWIRATTSGVTDSADIVVQFLSPIDSVSATPSADTIIDRGDTTRFSFNAWDSAGASIDTTASWWIGDPAVATIDSTGLATAESGGQTTVFAAVGQDTATATLRVEPIAYSFVSPYTDSLYAIGDTVQYSITSYTWMERVIGGLVPTWSSSDPGVATIDSTGVATAAGAGITTITTVVEDDTTTRSLWVVPVDTVIVDPGSYYFEFYLHQRQFAATALSATGDTIEADIAWSSSDTARVTITAGGLATAVGHGTARIRADAGSVRGTADVVSDVVTSIVVNPPSDTMTAIEDTTHFAATGYVDETTTVPADFWWSSSDPTVVTVDSASGVATAVDSGTAYLRATSLNDVDSARVDVVVSPPPFTYTELGYLGTAPGDADNAYAINDNGWIVGRARNDAGNNVAFVYRPDTGIQEIGTFPDPSFAFSIAWDINANNVAVGQSGHSDGDDAAFYWTADGGMVDIGDLAGAGARARGVNDSLQIVGESATGFGYDEAFLWDPDTGTMTSLGGLGGEGSVAWDINNAGTVVGNAQTAEGVYHAFVWTQDGGMIDLGTLGGASSYAYGINENGVVFGTSQEAGGDYRATVWLPPYGSGDIANLGTLGGPESWGHNGNLTRAIGWADDADGVRKRVVFPSEGRIIPVEFDGVIMEGLRGINGLDQMAGVASIDGVRTMIRIDPN
jgi:probable HAF family extracellular repeat protein